jgi:uncharacterized protein
MTEPLKNPEVHSTPEDRRLGEEWEDWDGQAENPIHPLSAGTFIFLIWVLLVLYLVMLGGLGWLIWPRVVSLHMESVGYILGGLLLGDALFFGICVFLGARGYHWAQKVLKMLGGVRWLISPSLWIGKWFGWSRDQIGHAFVQLHNRLEILPPLVRDATKLLVLVPRCLSKEVLTNLATLRTRFGFTQMTVVGGTEARRTIGRMKPEGIIAVACERDLLSGVKDVRGRVPILAFSNIRPEGPCKNTTVDLTAVEKGIYLFLGNAVKPVA